MESQGPDLPSHLKQVKPDKAYKTRAFKTSGRQATKATGPLSTSSAFA